MGSGKRELCVGGRRKKIGPALPKIRALEVCRLGDGVTLQRHRFGTQFEVFQVSVGVISRTVLLVAFYFFFCACREGPKMIYHYAREHCVCVAGGVVFH